MNESTTDRALLELAAKAAGITSLRWGLDKPERQISGEGEFIGATWNPLTDDGDAFRLAVQLRMLLDDVRKGYMAGHVAAVCRGEAAYEPRDPDPHAAMRRTIVRAAAEIGRSHHG